MDNDVLHKEIDLIQACITRMASNSFLLKGWAVSIIAVILALSGLKKQLPLFGVSCILSLGKDLKGEGWGWARKIRFENWRGSSGGAWRNGFANRLVARPSARPLPY